MKALERLIDELILEVTLFPNTHYRTITENEIKAAILKMFEEKDELLKNVNSLFNPCGHTGFESCVCNVCGYPEPVKRIAKLNQKIAELEAENEKLECCGNCEHMSYGVHVMCELKNELTEPDKRCDEWGER